MAYYLIPLLMFYFGVLLCIRFGGTSTGVLFLAALPLILTAVLRGQTGTDTAAYYEAFRGLDSYWDYGAEPLFKALAKTLWFLNPDPRFCINAISLITAILTIWGISRARFGAWFGGLLLMPALFFELTMNLLRFGLASSIFLLASAVPVERKPMRYIAFALVGTGFHFSSALLFVCFAITTTHRHMFIKGVFALAIAMTALVIPDYIASKTSLYSGMAAPNATSGLMFLSIQCALLGIIRMRRAEFALPRAGFWFCVGLALVFFLMTKVTYAGIRFQLILVYLLIVVLMRRYQPRDGRMSPQLALSLFVVGLLALGGRAHNMLDEEGRGRSPFLPYRPISSLEDFR